MATAIALVSDILGSTVTTCVYAKNKNIDLKRGWLLTVCSISMCAVGSVSAYYTHQQVLVGFSLFLCVCIGIRFLVKPGVKEHSTSGGMMMLIVFTAMLGYGRKTAVGTSTFIMTFTALIAAISHILIEPTIIIGCWNYLLISIVTATIFSMVSAKFANRVNAVVVGRVTGIILFALGSILIWLNYIVL